MLSSRTTPSALAVRIAVGVCCALTLAGCSNDDTARNPKTPPETQSVKTTGAVPPGNLSDVPLAAPREILPHLPEREPPRYHQVQRGETLSKLAQRYATTAQAIAKGNGILINDILHPGDYLLIPR